MSAQNIPVESRRKKIAGLAIGALRHHLGKSLEDQWFSRARDDRVGVVSLLPLDKWRQSEISGKLSRENKAREAVLKIQWHLECSFTG